VLVFLVGLSAIKVTWDGLEKRLRDLFAFTFDHIADDPDQMAIAIQHAMSLALSDVVMITIPQQLRL
jgi:hypothetical protein